MSEIRRFQGTAYYEKTRAKNASIVTLPYLRRNLRRALDCQQYDLLLERGDDPAGEIGGTRDDETITNWDFPPSTMLSDIIKGLEPTISIDKLFLRSGQSAQVKVTSRIPKAGRAGSPDWLPGQDEWKVPCQVSMRLVYRTDPKNVICHRVKNGHIARHTQPNKNSTFEIVLESAFKIELGRLKVMVEFKDKKGRTQWKRARNDDNCCVQFRIECNNSTDSADLLSQLERRHISEYSNISSEDGQIRFKWKDLPDLPTSGTLLDLKRGRRRTIEMVRYRAEVNMIWNQECQPLTAWNRACRLQQQEGSRQLPTPSLSDDSERSRTMRVQYLNRHNPFHAKCATNAGLYCIMESCDGRAEHSSLERLMLHYAIHHDHFKFEINAERSEDGLAVIAITRTDDGSTNISSPSSEFSWQAPNSAFDIASHLKGSKRWNVTHVNGKDKKSTPQKSPKKRAQGGHSAHIPIHLGPAKRATRIPEEVPDLPRVPKRRHEVPKVENVSFYRTSSKQKVSAGDEISDSEAEVDPQWTLQGLRQEQTLLGIDRLTQDFNELFNKHLDWEQPSSDVFLQQAIVRFARINVAQLSEPGWRERFQAKLEQFADKRVITPGTVSWCMGLLTTHRTEEEEESSHELSPSSQLLGATGRSTRGGNDFSTRTPEKSMRASTPPSHMSSRARLRWNNGKISHDGVNDIRNGAHRSALGSPTPTSASQHRKIVPFGRRRVVCRRGGTTSGPHRIFDFVQDDRRDVPHDAIRPKDLEFEKLTKVLKEDLMLDQKDVVVCISNGATRPIDDDDDWMAALKDVQVNAPPGDTVFELRPRHPSHSPTRGGLNASKRKMSHGEELPRKKVRIQEDLCVCGNKAEGLRGTFACGNSKCSGKFHLKCLNLQQRPVIEWLCEHCRAG